MTVARDSLVIWSARSAIGEVLGPYVLVLLVPVYILAFYVRQRDSHSVFGFIFVTFLVLCSILATLPVGERTFVILPFVIVFLFWKKISIHRLVITGVAGVLAAALLLPIFKMQESGNSSGSDLLLSSLNGDISRAPILADVLSDSALFGTRVMDYPGAGYVYSALYFVPRSLAPFKGQSTAVQYTAHTEHTSPDDTNWGLGISAVDELLLNFGIIFLPIGLLLYGYAIRQADRASQQIPSLTVPTRLTAVFLLGYHLPALLQDFGAMAITIFALHVLFARLEPVSTSVSI